MGDGTKLPDRERTPEFQAWLDAQHTDSTFARNAIWRQAHCWLDEDGRHIWFAHVCADGEWTETTLVYGRPTGLKGNGHGWCSTTEPDQPLTVAPSVSCDGCGFHAHFDAGNFPPGSLGRRPGGEPIDVEAEIHDAITAALAPRRNDAAFMGRLRDRIREDASILTALAERD